MLSSLEKKNLDLGILGKPTGDYTSRGTTTVDCQLLLLHSCSVIDLPAHNIIIGLIAFRGHDG